GSYGSSRSRFPLPGTWRAGAQRMQLDSSSWRKATARGGVGRRQIYSRFVTCRFTSATVRTPLAARTGPADIGRARLAPTSCVRTPVPRESCTHRDLRVQPFNGAPLAATRRGHERSVGDLL